MARIAKDMACLFCGDVPCSCNAAPRKSKPRPKPVEAVVESAPTPDPVAAPVTPASSPLASGAMEAAVVPGAGQPAVPRAAGPVHTVGPTAAVPQPPAPEVDERHLVEKYPHEPSTDLQKALAVLVDSGILAKEDHIRAKNMSAPRRPPQLVGELTRWKNRQKEVKR